MGAPMRDDGGAVSDVEVDRTFNLFVFLVALCLMYLYAALAVPPSAHGDGQAP